MCTHTGLIHTLVQCLVIQELICIVPLGVAMQSRNVTRVRENPYQGNSRRVETETCHGVIPSLMSYVGRTHIIVRLQT